MSDEKPEVQPTYGEAIVEKLDAYLSAIRVSANIVQARKELVTEIR